MTIYKVEWNDACNCHPEYRIWGHYLTEELAQRGVDEVWEAYKRRADIDEIEVIDE